MKGREMAGREGTSVGEGGATKYKKHTGAQVYIILAFCLFDAHRAGSMVQGDTNSDVAWGREED